MYPWFDIKRDPMYKRGLEIGEQSGLEKSHKIAIKNMLALNFEPEKIAGILETPLQKVLDFQKKYLRKQSKVPMSSN